MKRNTANYRTLIVTFCGVDLHIGQLFRRRGSVERHRAQRVDKRLYSTRFTQVGDHMAIITSEYNMTHVKKWLVRNILIKIVYRLETMVEISTIVFLVYFFRVAIM